MMEDLNEQAKAHKQKIRNLMIIVMGCLWAALTIPFYVLFDSRDGSFAGHQLELTLGYAYGLLTWVMQLMLLDPPRSMVLRLLSSLVIALSVALCIVLGHAIMGYIVHLVTGFTVEVGGAQVWLSVLGGVVAGAFQFIYSGKIGQRSILKLLIWLTVPVASVFLLLRFTVIEFLQIDWAVQFPNHEVHAGVPFFWLGAILVLLGFVPLLGYLIAYQATQPKGPY